MTYTDFKHLASESDIRNIISEIRDYVIENCRGKCSKGKPGSGLWVGANWVRVNFNFDDCRKHPGGKDCTQTSSSPPLIEDCPSYTCGPDEQLPENCPLSCGLEGFEVHEGKFILDDCAKADPAGFPAWKCPWPRVAWITYCGPIDNPPPRCQELCPIQVIQYPRNYKGGPENIPDPNFEYDFDLLFNSLDNDDDNGQTPFCACPDRIVSCEWGDQERREDQKCVNTINMELNCFDLTSEEDENGEPNPCFGVFETCFEERPGCLDDPNFTFCPQQFSGTIWGGNQICENSCEDSNSFFSPDCMKQMNECLLKKCACEYPCYYSCGGMGICSNVSDYPYIGTSEYCSAQTIIHLDAWGIRRAGPPNTSSWNTIIEPIKTTDEEFFPMYICLEPPNDIQDCSVERTIESFVIREELYHPLLCNENDK
jgi:hypothetical protein